MKEVKNVQSKRNLLVPILIVVIIILVLVLAYGIYSGIKTREDINFLNNELNMLSQENQNLIEKNDRLDTDILNLASQRDALQKNYDLLYQDVQKIYKSCPTENACKGRFPGVSWSCNNVGDDTIDPSHICICDSSCNLKATPIKN